MSSLNHKDPYPLLELKNRIGKVRLRSGGGGEQKRMDIIQPLNIQQLSFLALILPYIQISVCIVRPSVAIKYFH